MVGVCPNVIRKVEEVLDGSCLMVPYGRRATCEQPGTFVNLRFKFEFEYRPRSILAACRNHMAALLSRDVSKIMLDYTDKSELHTHDQGMDWYDHEQSCWIIPTKRTYTGLVEIQEFFDDLFDTLEDTSDMAGQCNVANPLYELFGHH